MRIAHLSDLHLLPDGALNLTSLLGRRLFGAANLVLLRHRVHSTEVVRAAVDAVVGQEVDHAVITGDLTNLALEPEFALAREVVDPLGGFNELTVVPGNHDYYAPDAVRALRFEKWFGHTLWSNGVGENQWPVVKDLGSVVLVAVRSATSPLPMCAHGRVGREQAEAAAQAVTRARADGKDTVVFFHHNLHRRPVAAEVTGRLLDKGLVSDVLARSGATLVLHGHDHREHEMVITGPGSDSGTPVVGCGSTSVVPSSGLRTGRFNIYDIEEGNVRVERWRYLGKEKRFAAPAG